MKVRWLGEPGSAESTDTLGHHFPKGKWIEVLDSDPAALKLRNNPAFETDAPADKAKQKADEHNAKVEADALKEREAAEAKLRKEEEAKAKAEADAKAKAAKAARA